MVRMVLVRVAKYLLSCYWSSSNDIGEEDNEESNYIERLVGLQQDLQYGILDK